MTPLRSPRHVAVLAVGFAISIAGAAGVFGPVHYEARPRAEQLIVLFLLPVTATVIWTLIGSLHARRLPAQENGSADAALRDIVLWVLLFLVGVHALMISVLFGAALSASWASRAVVMLVGVTLMAVGNLLPRTRPNMALGIRTSRTLSDRRLWILTHRTSGYAAVAVGAVTIFAAAFLDREQVAAVPGIAFLLAGAWLSVSYWKSASVSSHAPRA